jgi:site-specific recombinase XerD
MNLQKAIETFLLSKPNLGTRKAYSSCLNEMQDYLGPARPITEIDIHDLAKYADKLHNHPTWSSANKRKHIVTIKAFFNWLVDLGEIDKSPAKIIKTPKRQTSTRKKAMTDEEYDKILEYARVTSPRNYALLLFFGDTGCREIGLRRLQKSDLDLENRCAVVTEKGDKTRTVYFGIECQRALRRWLYVKKDGTTDFVFRERVNAKLKNGGELQGGVLSQVVNKIAKKVGINRPLGSHSLRHRKGHQFADSGTPITVAAKAMGHSSIEITGGFYYPEDDERVRQSVEKLTTGHEDEEKRRRAQAMKISNKIIQFSRIKGS